MAYYYYPSWTLIWSLVVVGVVLIGKGIFLIWYCCYYRPRRLAAMRTAQQNQVVFPSNQYGYSVTTSTTTTNTTGGQPQYPGAYPGAYPPASSAGPMPDKVPGAPPPYSSAYTNAGFGGEGASTPHPPGGAPYPPQNAFGGDMVNPPPYSATEPPSQTK